MCGIAGFKGFFNHVELAEKANDIQRHRGPDAQLVWSTDNLSLAHQRLSIIDLNPRSNQPFEKYEYVIVFNGEVYNYQSLKDRYLNDKGIHYITESDTEVVLEMYRHYGKDCLQYFEGMFAFAIYNKTDGSIFLARDHFGIKPLFYYHDASRFAFASELKVLAKNLDVKKNINHATLIASLNYLWVPGNDSIFSDIYKLPPAHYMEIDRDNRMTMRQYWAVNDQNMLDMSEAELINLVDEAMADTISRHMIADVEVGAFLSGGLDSSLICALAAKHVKRLKTFTIATSEEDKKVEKNSPDEHYAKILANKFGFDHHEILIRHDIVNDLPNVVRMLDEPIGDPAAINTYLICSEARKSGIKVLLSGMGADEIFFGYRRQKATLMALQYQQVPSLVRSGIRSLVDALPVKFMGQGVRNVRWAKKFLSFADLPVDEAYRMSYSYYDPAGLNNILVGDHQGEINQLARSHRELFFSKFQNDPHNQMCNTDINMFMVGLNLTYSDRASMAASTELRVPFIDKKIVELAMRIPGKWKYKNGESKYILKKCAERHIPSDIIYRPKASFGAPIRSWMSGGLAEMTDDLLSDSAIAHRGIFDSREIRKLINNDRAGIEDNAYRIYQLLTLELWMREYLDS